MANFLPCLGLSEHFDFLIEEDSFNLGFNKKTHESIEGCPRFPKKSTILTYSEAFMNVEKKREKKGKAEEIKSSFIDEKPELYERIGGFKIKVDF